MKPLDNRYYAAPIMRHGKASMVIVWNGVHDYKNDPHSLVNAQIPELAPLHSNETLLIVQVGKPVGSTAVRSKTSFSLSLPRVQSYYGQEIRRLTIRSSKSYGQQPSHSQSIEPDVTREPPRVR
jgi:hypothetical protein